MSATQGTSGGGGGGNIPPENASQPPGDQASAAVAFAWITAWTVMLILLFALNRTRIGHVLIYYALVLMIVLLLVTNVGWFVQAFQPFTDAVAGQGVDQSTAGGQETIPTPGEAGLS